MILNFNQGALVESMDIIYDYPTKIAQLLIDDEVDIALVPVAAIPSLNHYEIISNYCIGASNPVASVCMFSQVPIAEIDQVILDYQSVTSAALLKILLKESWHINPQLINVQADFESSIKGNTAGLIIGDRALMQLGNFKYVYDLAEAWQKLTGFPFVFAAWVANKKIPEAFLSSFNDAIKLSLQKKDEIIQSIDFPLYDLSVYFNQNIDYVLDEKKRSGLNLFLQKLNLIQQKM